MMNYVFVVKGARSGAGYLVEQNETHSLVFYPPHGLIEVPNSGIYHTAKEYFNALSESTIEWNPLRDEIITATKLINSERWSKG